MNWKSCPSPTSTLKPPKQRLYQDPDAFAPLADQAEPLAALVRHTALIDALYHEQREKIRELGLAQACYDIDLPLCAVLARDGAGGLSGWTGTPCPYLGSCSPAASSGNRRPSIPWPGRNSTFYSTKQLGHILFDKLGLPPVKKTKTGYSTNAEVLEKLGPPP